MIFDGGGPCCPDVGGGADEEEDDNYHAVKTEEGTLHLLITTIVSVIRNEVYIKLYKLSCYY